jgi:NDP-sugar pyrophosphorylase family protein
VGDVADVGVGEVSDVDVGDGVGDVVGVGEVSGNSGGVASWETITE